MGQRSQLFATATSRHDSQISRQGRYYQWVWGPNMLVRAAQVIRYLNAATETGVIKRTRPEEFTAGAYLQGADAWAPLPEWSPPTG